MGLLFEIKAKILSVIVGNLCSSLTHFVGALHIKPELLIQPDLIYCSGEETQYQRTETFQ